MYRYRKKGVDIHTPEEVLTLTKTNIVYDYTTGELKNLKTKKIYSSLSKKGYVSSISIRYNNIEWIWSSGRLIWFLMTGEVLSSEYQIDHINRICNDNRWVNLRKVTQSQNQMNTKSREGTSSGYKGVSFDKESGRFSSIISIGGGNRTDKKEFRIGRFVSEIEAAKFYDRAAKYYHKEYAYLNFPDDEIFPASIEDLRKELKWNKK